MRQEYVVTFREDVTPSEASKLMADFGVKQSAIQTTRLVANYSEEQESKIGGKIAEVFRMRADRESERKGRWQMSWGSKTNLGVFKTLMRIAEDISKGCFDKIDSPK